ncbi:hypothetical protein B7494_g170 [Chlorociboria aeruginascens]|nr:hypothetical protein B7494_g170 [Chlorociboria aeruginascens]
MADVKIKPDPAVKNEDSPPHFEDDVYEDAGDLEFNTNKEYQSLYLAKVPKFLWEAWSELDDDAEIQIGTIRTTVTREPNGRQGTSLSMLLSSDIPQHQTIPKEYSLDITTERTKNTFLFTEQDLPGFKSKSKAKFDAASANMPARLTRIQKDRPGPMKFDPNKKFQPYFRKAIPKRTTLAGRVAHEINCVPVDNAEARFLMGERTLEAMRPKLHTKFLKDDESNMAQGFILPGTVQAEGTFNNFIKTRLPGTGKKSQQEKTARMPQNELLDKIFNCFRKYNYWSMKALRAELQQPEQYLRETLEKVAVLAKSGRFATQWSLKQENKLANYEAIGDEVAPVGINGMDGAEDSDMGDVDDDDDDEDVKFEDVVA